MRVSCKQQTINKLYMYVEAKIHVCVYIHVYIVVVTQCVTTTLVEVTKQPTCIYELQLSIKKRLFMQHAPFSHMSVA